MSSIDDLKVLDRAAAAPFVNFPVTPTWYPPMAGAWFAVIAAATTLMSKGMVAGWALLALDCAALVAFTAWYRKQWGTWPDISQAPIEIARAYRVFASLALVVAALGTLACWCGGALIGAAVTFAASTPVVWWYERRLYPAACKRVRARFE